MRHRAIGIHGVDDAVGEVWKNMLRTHSSTPALDDREARSYLRTTIENTIKSFLRRPSVPTIDTTPEGPAGNVPDRRGARDTPACLVPREERTQILVAALQRLGAADRQLYSWYYRDGLTFLQIGVRLGIGDDGAAKRVKAMVGRFRRNITVLTIEDLSSTT